METPPSPGVAERLLAFAAGVVTMIG